MAYDLSELVAWVLKELEPAVRVGRTAGQYASHVGGKEAALYGNADMACILYTLDALHPSPKQRAEWMRGLQSFQDPGSGYFIAKTALLGKIHNTAFCVAAMKLFDERPSVPTRLLHPLRFADLFASPEQMGAYVRALDWQNAVYPSGEDVIGLAATFFNVKGMVKPSWFRALMDYFDKSLFDPNNGMVGRGKPPQGDLDQIGGTFHFAFFWPLFDRQMPSPQARVDAILGLQRPGGLWTPSNPWWLTFDSVYMLADAASRSSYRRSDVRAAIEAAVGVCYERAMEPATREEAFCTPELGVHTLNGTLSLFAVAQRFLGREAILSPRPLRLVLDRRPYI